MEKEHWWLPIQIKHVSLKRPVVDFRKESSDGYPLMTQKWTVDRPGGRWNLSKQPKISNNYQRDLTPNQPASKGFYPHPVHWLRTVIGRIASENGKIPPSGNRLTICPPPRDKGGGEIVADVRSQKGINQERNQIQLVRPCYETLSPVAMSPPTQQQWVDFRIND